jgi:DNA-binding NarL/FixJ family response regulator
VPTSVLLADFQFLTRQGIASLIQSISGFQIIHEINDSSELKGAIDKFQPDLTVLDIPDKNSPIISILEEIKQKYAGKFLIISNNQNRESVKRLLNMGVKGIVTKNCSEEEITTALHSVSNNHKFFCDKVLDLVIEDQDKKKLVDSANLSPREYEVLMLIAKGNTTYKIADQLFLSVHTVNSHRKNILKKLNIKSPAALISYAIQSGLVNV